MTAWSSAERTTSCVSMTLVVGGRTPYLEVRRRFVGQSSGVLRRSTFEEPFLERGQEAAAIDVVDVDLLECIRSLHAPGRAGSHVRHRR